MQKCGMNELELIYLDCFSIYKVVRGTQCVCVGEGERVVQNWTM